MSPDAARELQLARLIYPLYRAVIERFELEMFPCRDLEQEAAPDADALTRIQLWLSEAEKHIEVAHIRQFLQGNSVPELNVRALIFRYLQKQEKNDSDRYKVDFLLGHYLAQNMPPDVLNQGDVKLAQVAQVLAPVLGDQGYLGFLEELDAWVRELQSCEHVQDLIDRKILEKGKHLKAEAGGRYFHQAAMIAFTRFNFLARRCLIKLLATDLDEIGKALGDLQSQGAQTIDCSAAGLGASESLASLRERIKQWRKPFQGKYSEVEWLEQIARVRALLKSSINQQPAQAKVTVAAAEPVATMTPVQAPPAAQAKAPTPQVKPQAPQVKPTQMPTQATPPATAVPAASGAAAAAKLAVKSPAASPKPAPAAARPPQKSFAVLLRERWKAFYPLIERWFGVLRTQALDLWGRAREGFSQAKSGATEAQQAAPPSTPAPQAKTPSGRIVQPSALVRDAIKRVSEQAASLAADSDATITLEEVSLSLNAREVNAFRRPHDNLSGILQRSVAVRLILIEALRRGGSHGDVNLNATLKFAYTEAAMLQDRVAHARTNKDVDGALQLSICSRSLQSLVDQAERSLSQAGTRSR